uniref:Uncharacterized protein n=1 Tax=Listeria ivanovii TaxID=1638 RepID=A0A7T0Q8H5_LISIV|nr:hypothetical protein pLIS600086c [Listeria ivanovii]
MQEFFLENATTMEKQLFHQIKSLDADQQKHLLQFLDSFTKS